MSRSAGIAATGCAWRCARTAARPSRTIACSSAFAPTPTRASSSRPGAPTRSACIWRICKYPIVGDPVYGGRFGAPARRRASSSIDALARLQAPGAACRRASRSIIRAPASGSTFESAVPPDFAGLLEALRDDARRRAHAARAAPVGGLMTVAWLTPRLAGAARGACAVDAARRRGERRALCDR